MKEQRNQNKRFYGVLNSLSRRTRADTRDTNFDRTPPEIYASPEEGILLISAFVRIKQPELRAAIIKLTTQVADGTALTGNVQN
jgi:hypothetical protein